MCHKQTGRSDRHTDSQDEQQKKKQFKHNKAWTNVQKS